ncbi:MAG: integrase arm-type DNA-binding domain-containing protein [Pseudomonadota bacterium]
MTQDFCKSAPEGKHWSSDLTGLSLWVSPKGTRSWYVQRTVNGKACREQIGRFPQMTATEARHRAIALLNEWQTEAPKPLRQVTLEQSLREYLSRDRLKASSKRGIEDRIRMHLSDWLDRPLSSITGKMLVARHKELTPKGKRMANHVMQTFRLLWNRADALGAKLGSCPTAAVDFHPEPPSGVYIDDPEKWVKEVHALENRVHAAFYVFLLYTGLRGPSEAMPLSWDRVLDDRFVFETTKSGRPFELPRLPIHDPILDATRDLHHEWVFPAGRGGMHLKSPARLSWSPHAHRRTFGRHAMQELPERKVGWLLNHASTSLAGQRYAPRGIDMLQQPMEVAVAEIQKVFPAPQALL